MKERGSEKEEKTKERERESCIGSICERKKERGRKREIQ